MRTAGLYIGLGLVLIALNAVAGLHPLALTAIVLLMIEITI